MIPGTAPGPEPHWRGLPPRAVYAGLVPLACCVLEALKEAAGDVIGKSIGAALTELLFVFVLIFGFGSLYLLTMAMAFRRAPVNGAHRLWVLAAGVVVGSLPFLLFNFAFGRPLIASTTIERANQLGNWAEFLLLGAVLTAYYEVHLRRAASLEALFRARTASAALDAEVASARLRTLTAQIEPHFLFNTLASVRRLSQIDRPTGASMLDHLIGYFDAALPRLRRDDASLEEEEAQLRDYLEIHRIRMGRRLTYAIDIPESLRAARVPSMMLLTLVENAIKHGLDPLPEGGYLSVEARARWATLELRVSDTGRGMGEGAGHGTGLANIRARLAALHSSRASLALAHNRPRGVTATLSLPLVAT